MADPSLSASPIRSLYVHVPFCAQKCSYCAFYSHKPDVNTVDRYVSAVVTELGGLEGQVQLDTIFFGGGTPSILNLRQWERVFRALDNLSKNVGFEFSVECNPATVSPDKAALLKERGVNRISMGVQSFDSKLLDELGRIHTRDMVFRSYDILKNAGFVSINLDLMFAIPGQDMKIWNATLDEAIALQSEHLSCYEVIYEEDTALYARLNAGEFSVNEELAADMYERLIERSSAAGFRQYEVANFARSGVADSDIPGHACRHNVNYWRGGAWYGAGPSAAGFLDGVRVKNVSSTELYCDYILGGRSAVIERDELSAIDRAAEILAFGLRMNVGWGIGEFREVTGFDVREHWRDVVEQLTVRGWLDVGADRLKLTALGHRFADAAAAEFLSPDSMNASPAVASNGL